MQEFGLNACQML
jgi:hypothetical protein